MQRKIKQLSGSYGPAGEVRLSGIPGAWVNLILDGVITLEMPTIRSLRDALTAYLNDPVQAAVPTKRRPHGAQEYKGNGNHKWEEVTVDAKGAGHTYRLRVVGGWLYRTVSAAPIAGSAPSVSVVFVPMPDTVGYAV
jgi:hypothetical protein